MCGTQFAGLNCAVKRKSGFQRFQAGRGSVSACRNKCKMPEGTMTRKFDVIAIGTGSAASAVASRCREAGWQVAIVDSRPFGGTCALRGCDPKKVLVGAAEAVDWIRRMKGKGIQAEKLQINWPELMRFKRSFTEPVPKRREDGFATAGIAAFHGRARFAGPNRSRCRLHRRFCRPGARHLRAPRGGPGRRLPMF